MTQIGLKREWAIWDGFDEDHVLNFIYQEADISHLTECFTVIMSGSDDSVGEMDERPGVQTLSND